MNAGQRWTVLHSSTSTSCSCEPRSCMAPSEMDPPLFGTASSNQSNQDSDGQGPDKHSDS
eukprot:1141529-Pelagomonas_calceolata.AAC.3